MAIETIGSMMSLRWGDVRSLRPQTVMPQETGKPVAESTDATAQEVGAQLDRTTAGVAKVQETGEDGSNAYSGNGQSNQPSNDQIKQAVDQLNKKMANSEAVFGIHEKTNRVTIKIVKKVIKELPPEKTLDMIAKVWEMAGILVDEKR